MQSFPHHYAVDASGREADGIVVTAEGLPDLQCAPPAQFDGPGDQWSPESLLVAAVASCFILTFRAVAGASKVSWTALRCSADGVLDRADGGLRFTGMELRARLTIPADVDADKAQRLLEKAEKSCLVTRSLAFETTLECEVVRE